MLRTILFILFAAIAHTQPATGFEVASLKLAPEGDRLSIKTDGGMARYSHLTLRQLIAIANRIDNSRVLGGPAWLDMQHYDVVAKLPAGATRDQIPPMLDHLLQERLKVVVHRETKDEKVLALVVGKGGPKLTKSENPSGGGSIFPGGIKASGIPMASLAGMLKRPAGIEVVDRTGMEGTYDIDLKYRKDENDDSADLFTAIQEQLGLKLEPSRAPIDTLIVDSAERVPIEN